ncbi:MAG: hypothetical protein AAGD06_01725 [Acidobacteriota bacterium]
MFLPTCPLDAAEEERLRSFPGRIALRGPGKSDLDPAEAEIRRSLDADPAHGSRDRETMEGRE